MADRVLFDYLCSNHMDDFHENERRSTDHKIVQSNLVGSDRTSGYPGLVHWSETVSKRGRSASAGENASQIFFIG